MKRFASIVPILLILLAPPVMMYPLWANPVSAGEDDVIFYYPLRKMVGQAMAQGRWPQANPLEATGGALAADPQAAVLHPATWLFAAIDAKVAYTLSIFLAFWLAGVGMYLYLRRLGLARSARTFGAVAFMFCGFMVGHRVHLSMIHTAAMLPWLLWGIELLRGGPAASKTSQPCAAIAPPLRRRGAFAVLAVALLLAIAAGNWPTLVQMSILCAAYFLVRARPFGKALATAGGAAAIAVIWASPQIIATWRLLEQTTRQKIGLATAGENSFFPVDIVMAVLPMIMGNRHPNFFGQSWWGSWHQCEMLGYVGLATMVLAGSAVWRLFRKKSAAQLGDSQQAFGPLVRLWTWLIVGLGIWMLGYYLPTYSLIHMLPVLGVVRCPARMVLGVDLALATLAAITIHLVAAAPAGEVATRWAKTLRRAACRVLPAAMLAAVALLAGLAWGVSSGNFWQFFTGGSDAIASARAALSPANPAIYVPLGLLAATIAVIFYWLARPARRSAALVALLLVDLLFIVRFVDMPAGGAAMPDPEVSPAAQYLRERGAPGAWRVWGLSSKYYLRPAELLLPKTGQSLGIATITSYGPFQSPAHAQLLGFNICGYHRDWVDLLRRNYLLSLYRVRYILAAEQPFREVIESIRIPNELPPTDGPNLLTTQWKLDRASSWTAAPADGHAAEEGLEFVTPLMFLTSSAQQTVELSPQKVYRISLDARAPQGAANFLRAEVRRAKVRQDSEDRGLLDGQGLEWDDTGLAIRAEEIAADWRHFEWTFQSPADVPSPCIFKLSSVGERPVLVRNVSLAQSHFSTPVSAFRTLAPGEAVYRAVAELPAASVGEPSVVIYENLLCPQDAAESQTKFSGGEIERLKWLAPAQRQSPTAPAAAAAVPDVSLHADVWPWAWAAVAWALGSGAFVAILLAAGRKGRTNLNPQ